MDDRERGKVIGAVLIGYFVVGPAIAIIIGLVLILKAG